MGEIPPSEFGKYAGGKENSFETGLRQLADKSKGEFDDALSLLDRYDDGRGGTVNAAIRRHLEMLKQEAPAMAENKIKAVNGSRLSPSRRERERSASADYGDPELQGVIEISLMLADQSESETANKNGAANSVPLYHEELRKIFGEYRDPYPDRESIRKLVEGKIGLLRSPLQKAPAEVVSIKEPAEAAGEEAKAA